MKRKRLDGLGSYDYHPVGPLGPGLMAGCLVGCIPKVSHRSVRAAVLIARTAILQSAGRAAFHMLVPPGKYAPGEESAPNHERF